MTVRLLLFARLRDCLEGEGAMLVSLPDGATGRDLAAWLGRRSALLEPLTRASRLAVNCAYVPWDAALCDGDEVALIPPVSGG